MGLFLTFGGLSEAKTVKRSSKRPPSAKKSAPRSAAAKTPSKGVKSRAVARRSTQQAPTPERYTEIKQALADKGYYRGPINGKWDPGATEALKSFQEDQRLANNGKLTSVSIIALGLGPKRNAGARPTMEARPTDDNRRTEGSERP